MLSAIELYYHISLETRTLGTIVKYFSDRVILPL